MLAQKRFFYLKEDFSLPDVKFNDTISDLIELDIIYKKFDGEKNDYIYTRNYKIIISSNGKKVNFFSIEIDPDYNYFKVENSLFYCHSIELFANAICEKNEYIVEVNESELSIPLNVGCYMVLIFGDFIPKYFFITKGKS